LNLEIDGEGPGGETRGNFHGQQFDWRWGGDLPLSNSGHYREKTGQIVIPCLVSPISRPRSAGIAQRSRSLRTAPAAIWAWTRQYVVILLHDSHIVHTTRL